MEQASAGLQPGSRLTHGSGSYMIHWGAIAVIIYSVICCYNSTSDEFSLGHDLKGKLGMSLPRGVSLD